MITKYLRLLLRISVIYGDNRPPPSSTVYNYASLLFLMLATWCSLFPTRASPLQITHTLLKSSDEKPNVCFASLIAVRPGMLSRKTDFRHMRDNYRISWTFNACYYKNFTYISRMTGFTNSESTTNSFSKWNDTSNISIFQFYIDESRNELSEWHVLLQALSSKCTIRTK